MWNLPKDQPRPFLRPAILHQIPATQLRFGSDHGELVLRGHVRGKPCKAGVNSTMLLFKQAGVRPISMALTSKTFGTKSTIEVSKINQCVGPWLLCMKFQPVYANVPHWQIYSGPGWHLSHQPFQPDFTSKHEAGEFAKRLCAFA